MGKFSPLDSAAVIKCLYNHSDDQQYIISHTITDSDTALLHLSHNKHIHARYMRENIPNSPDVTVNALEARQFHCYLWWALFFFLCCSAVTTAPVHRWASGFVQEAQSWARRPDGREGCKQQRRHQGDPARREGGGCFLLEDHPIRAGQRHQVGETPEGQKAKCKSFLLQPSSQQFFQQIRCANHNNSISSPFDFLQYFSAAIYLHMLPVFTRRTVDEEYFCAFSPAKGSPTTQWLQKWTTACGTLTDPWRKTAACNCWNLTMKRLKQYVNHLPHVTSGRHCHYLVPEVANKSRNDELWRWNEGFTSELAAVV